jgi:hypothetical protein
MGAALGWLANVLKAPVSLLSRLSGPNAGADPLFRSAIALQTRRDGRSDQKRKKGRARKHRSCPHREANAWLERFSNECVPKLLCPSDSF